MCAFLQLWYVINMNGSTVTEETDKICSKEKRDVTVNNGFEIFISKEKKMCCRIIWLFVIFLFMSLCIYNV